MPLWAAVAPRCTTRTAIDRFGRTAAAAACCRHGPRLANIHVRLASTHVAPSAINLRPNIPPHHQALHDALSALSSAAATWANTSRLHLALSGLAASNGVTRVALLGLGNQIGAQRLARLLLADPLGGEAEWETQLGAGSGGAVLLKYGEAHDTQPPTPLYRVLAVPSRVLRLHNLEILVSTLNVHVHVAHHATAPASTQSAAESLLVPRLQATSARGTPVPYPVHKTLVFGESLDDAVDFGRFSADSAGQLDSDTVRLALQLPAPSSETPVPDGTSNNTTAVDVDVGTQAINAFRASVQNALAYEHGWFRSGLPVLSQWLLQGLQPSDTLKPAMKTLIASIADDVAAKLEKEDCALRQRQASTPAHSATAASILSHLASWAETSHTELRDHLDAAFSSPSWHKLAWYKLLWRVDDVTMLSTEILERRWLVSAEKSSIFLAGRMDQAGFPDDVRHLPTAARPHDDTASTPDLPHPPLSMSTEVRKPDKWVNHIATARAELVQEAVPPLQALAQRLLLQTFSTTAMSSALTAILYLGLDSFSMFEAGAVAALGLTFSLRRMQRLWEGARERWEGTVREEGRRALKETEEVVASIVQRTDLGGDVVGGGGGGADEEAKMERERAWEAVGRVREALEKTCGDGEGKTGV